MAKRVEEAWGLVDVDSDENMQKKMGEVYAAFANKAEQAIAEATGTVLPRVGCRATKPRAVWHSVLPEKAKGPPYLVDGILHALRGALVQAGRVHEHPRGVGRGLGNVGSRGRRGRSRQAEK